jgi:Protein of unknown function DUF58
MKTSSTTSWRPSQSPAKPDRLLIKPFQWLANCLRALSEYLTAPKRRKAPTLAATDAFAAAPEGSGLRIRLNASRYLFVERSCFSALLASALLYAAAAFLANEWLYLLSSALFLSALLSVVYPLLILASIEADAWMPEYGADSSGAEIMIRIKQKLLFGPFNYLLPLSSLRARAILARRTIGGYAADDVVAKHSFCLQDCGQFASIKLRVPTLGRGVYKLSHLDVATCMPFGLCWAIGRIHLVEDATKQNALVVMPTATELRGDFLKELNGIYSPVGLRFANVRAFTQSTSVRGLREFRTGDSLRHIHWPTSARLGRLLVREFDSETLPVFNIYLDLGTRWQNRQQFELAIRLAYSLVCFGNEYDMLPQVFVCPPIDAAELDELMCDLPQMKPPADMLNEIFARVEPLPFSSSREMPEMVTRYQLLAIVPSKDLVLIAGGESSPVKLLVVEPEAAIESGRCIATVYSERDLAVL